MPKWFASERLGSVLAPRKVLGRVDPLGLAGAMVQVGTRTATNGLPRRAAGLGVELAKVAVGRSSITPDPKDWRFENRAWKENPLFHRLGQAYLAWSRMALDLVEDAQFDWRTAERAKLATVLFTAALAPTNVPLLNPDALERAFETGGRSLAKGLGNISRDLRTNRGFPRSVDRSAFVVGRDLAVTPGAVVFRNEVCELLQYTPATETVHDLPMVMVPPQINKYYFMDLAPGRSFVEFALKQGIQMFTISWRNPTEEHSEWGLSTYVDAVNDAARAACEIAGTDQANTVSLCAGGITTAALLGHLAATQDTLVNCATFAVTLLGLHGPDHDRPAGQPGHRRELHAFHQAGRRAARAQRHRALLHVAAQRPHLELLGAQQPDGRGAPGLRHSGVELRRHAPAGRPARRLPRSVHAELDRHGLLLGPRRAHRPQQGRV